MCDVVRFEIADEQLTVAIRAAVACVKGLDGPRLFIEAVKLALADCFDFGEGKVTTDWVGSAHEERIALTIAVASRPGVPTGIGLDDGWRNVYCRRIGDQFDEQRRQCWAALERAAADAQREPALF